MEITMFRQVLHTIPNNAAFFTTTIILMAINCRLVCAAQVEAIGDEQGQLASIGIVARSFKSHPVRLHQAHHTEVPKLWSYQKVWHVVTRTRLETIDYRSYTACCTKK